MRRPHLLGTFELDARRPSGHASLTTEGETRDGKDEVRISASANFQTFGVVESSTTRSAFSNSPRNSVTTAADRRALFSTYGIGTRRRVAAASLTNQAAADRMAYVQSVQSSAAHASTTRGRMSSSRPARFRRGRAYHRTNSSDSAARNSAARCCEVLTS